MRERVLITGADGFIGSHLTEMLIGLGYNVRAFCLYNSQGSWGWLDTLSNETKEKLEVILGDIRDPLCVKNSMKDCEYVFHLAALIAIPYSYIAPSSYIDTNIHGTLNIMQAARELGVKRVVHTSTSETYGTAQYVPINEEHPQVGQSPYAATKIGADQIALSFYRSFGTPVVILRPFNTYGPRQSNRAVIPTIITQINSGIKKLKLGALSPTRDFNFVLDTCSAFLAVANARGIEGKVINSASNFEISIRDTAILIANEMNTKIEFISDKNRLRPENSEVKRLYGDNTLIKKLTSWKPKYNGLSGFKTGLNETINWFTDERNTTNYKYNIYNI